MRSTRMIPIAAALLLAVALASAQSSPADDPGASSGKSDEAGMSGAAQASLDDHASEEAKARIEAIREQGAKASAKERAKAEKKLDAASHAVEGEVESAGEDKVASRLAEEFGTTTEVLLEQKAQCECGWGELMIANTLAANSNDGVTVDEIFMMREDDMGWGQIAAGMGFKLGDLVGAVKSEAQVARGAAKADGRVAVVGGPGSRHEAAGRAEASAHANGGAVRAGAGAGAGGRATVPTPRVPVGH